MLQLSASIEKTLLEKKRNIRITICECCSHLFIIGILVLGYGLSIIAYFPEMVYDSYQIQIPPTTSFAGGSQALANLLNGPLPVPSLDSFLLASKFISSQTAGSQFTIALESSQFGARYNNLLNFGGLHIAPYPSDEVDSLIQHLNSTLSIFSSLPIYKHASESIGAKYIVDHLDTEWTLALIVLREISPSKINYVIRQNYQTVPSTSYIINRLTIGLDNSYQKYVLGGYLSLQNTIDAWAFDYLHVSSSKISSTCSNITTTTAIPFPTAAYSQNPFYPSVGFLLGLAFTMSMVYPVARLVKSLVEEKELRQRELVKIMGLYEWIHGLSWWITAFFLFLWIAISASRISSGFLPKTNKLILFTYFFMFGMSAITLCFLISVFFTNSKLAAIVGPVVLNVLILPKYIFFGTDNNQSLSMRVLASLLSPTAFTFGADLLSAYEYAEIGIQFNNINDPGYNMNICLGMMLFDAFLYGFLAWYLDNIIQHDIGIAKHPLFFLFPSYWCGSCSHSCHASSLSSSAAATAPHYGRITDAHDGNHAGSPISQFHIASLHIDAANFEPIPHELEPSIKMSLNSMWKQYSDGKVAVKGVSLDILEGQITCLLGHNGAGKSTTIAMLTGLTSVTAGDCCIYGNYLSSNLNEIRQITGICPQQNIIFPALTVQEHLNYIGSIKGLGACCGNLREKVVEIMHEVNIFDKRNSPAFSLSGGMKRKLCLAMALIGDPKLVILDEPTSGMDPCSRRAVWDLLQRKKVGRIIILTTHFMDEADIISDRIAIMSDGVIRCVGSSLFLKNRFGAGYVLTVAQSERNLEVNASLTETHRNISMQLQSSANADAANQITTAPAEEEDVNSHSIQIHQVTEINIHQSLTAAITAIIPDAMLSSAAASGGELVYHLPFSCAQLLPQLFQFLQCHGVDLGIVSYGVSITSLEQVFIKLAQEQHRLDQDNTLPEAPKSSIVGTCGKRCRSWLRAGYNIFLEMNRRTYPLPVSQQDCGMEIELGLASSSDPHGAASEVEQMPSSGTNTVNSSNRIIPHEETRPTNGSSEIGDNRNNAIENHDNEDAHCCSSAIEQVEVRESCENRSTAITSSTPTPNGAPLVVHSTVSPVNSMMMEDTLFEEDGFDSSISSSQLSVQLLELLRKRFIVASRDMKGLFFQIIFPAMQILLVLAILTIRINPAGPTMRLSAYSFLVNPTVLIAGDEASPRIRSNQSSSSQLLIGNLSQVDMDLMNASFCLNSSETSQFLLNKFHPDVELQPAAFQQIDYSNISYPIIAPMRVRKPAAVIAGDKYGAYVSNDSIKFNITVDWDWIRSNANQLLVVSNTSTQLIVDYFNKHYFPLSISLNNLNLSGMNISLLPLDNQHVQIPANFSTVVTTRIEKLLKRANVTSYNHTALEVFIRSVFKTINNTTLSFNFSNINQQDITLRLTSQKLLYIPQNASVILEDSFLYIQTGSVNISIALGNVTVPIAQLLQLMPTGHDRYIFQIPSRYTVMHNASSPHGIAIFQAELRNAYFRTCSPELASGGDNSGSYQGSEQGTPVYIPKNHPLPITSQLALELRIILSFVTSLFILIPLCFIPAAFVSFVVKERACKSKHLQIVSSINPHTYWLATYIWDMGMYTTLAVLIMAVSTLYGLAVPQSFVSTPQSGLIVFTLLMMYGFSVLPLCYLYSFLFDNPSTCQISVTVINFVTGFILVLTYFIMASVPSTQHASTLAVHVFRFFPPYNVGEGLIQINIANYENSIIGTNIDLFSWHVAGQNITFMALEAIGFFMIVLLLESSWLQQVVSWIHMKRVSLANGSMLTARSSQEDNISENPANHIPISSQMVVDEDVRAEEELVSRLITRKLHDLREIHWNASNYQDITQIPANAIDANDNRLDDNAPNNNNIHPSTNNANVAGQPLPDCENPANMDDPNDFVLLLHDLRKIYPPAFLGGSAKYAIQGLSLAIRPGERFGFLGVNGAGKSTTLGVLTGDISPTTGVGYISGYDMQSAAAKLCLGLCPQEDPLLDQMNAYETLWFFGRIRGIPSTILQRRIDALINKVGLQKYAHRMCGNYSGGNKRKLSLAVAMIGNPKLLLLDEPSSGMDPEARRHMWDVISSVSKDRSVILTTHSMEECEALCSRIGIMVQGKLQCLGTNHHLKSRFGKGYEIQLRCAQAISSPNLNASSFASNLNVSSAVSSAAAATVESPNVNDMVTINRLFEQFKELFPSAIIKEQHGNYICIRCDDGLALDCAFEWLENRKKDTTIIEYSINQASLEQIFVEFAQLKGGETIR